MRSQKVATMKSCLSVGVLVVLFTVILQSCSYFGDNKNVLIEEVEDYFEFQDFDLSNYGIPATLKLPDETANIGAAMQPEVHHLESDFYWNIQVGPNFLLYIEDFGDNTNLVKEHKQKLENTQFYDVEYIVDEADLIVYKITLKVRGHANASKNVGVKHESYHVYGERVINGIHYEMRSRDEGFDKPIIDLMAKSIRSIKEKDQTKI